jgi:transcriptional regulator
MYIPRLFHESSWPEIRKVIEGNSFATVVTCNAGLPTATHVPLRLLESASGAARLQGHMSRANPHWRLFEHEGQSLVIFAGPDAYVSPRWYDHVNVPTWDYVAVHIYGKPRLVTDPGDMHELIKGLVDRYEGAVDVEERYTVEGLPAGYLDSQMKGIVGFEISVDEVQASFKLSQNRDEKNYENVITELGKSDDQKAQDIAQMMSSRRCPRP